MVATVTEADTAELLEDVRKVVNEQLALEAAIERVGTGRARPSDSTLLEKAGFGGRRLQDEISRVLAIRNLQKKAGTPALYDAAEQAAAAACETRDKTATRVNPQIQSLRKQIAKLESELQESARAAETAKSVVGAMDAAHQRLRDMVPETMKTAYSRLRATVGSAIISREDLSKLRHLAQKGQALRDMTPQQLEARKAEEQRNPPQRSFLDLQRESDAAMERLANIERQIDGLMEPFQVLRDPYCPM